MVSVFEGSPSPLERSLHHQTHIHLIIAPQWCYFLLITCASLSQMPHGKLADIRSSSCSSVLLCNRHQLAASCPDDPLNVHSFPMCDWLKLFVSILCEVHGICAHIFFQKGQWCRENWLSFYLGCREDIVNSGWTPIVASHFLEDCKNFCRFEATSDILGRFVGSGSKHDLAIAATLRASSSG